MKKEEIRALAYEYIKKIAFENPSPDFQSNENRFFIASTWVIDFIDFIEKQK